MAASSQQKYDEVSISSSKSELITDQYRVYLKLDESHLLNIEAEHRQTKQVYKKENIDNKQIESLTNGFCQAVEELFYLIQDVLAPTTPSFSNLSSTEQQERHKQINQTYSIEEKDNTLDLRFNISMGLGRLLARKWSFMISLKKVEMDDVTRHERIMVDLCRRVEYFEKRFIPPLDKIQPLPNVKFCIPHSSYRSFTLSNNNKICTAIYEINGYTGGELNVDQPFTSNPKDEMQKVSFIFTAGSMQNVRVGVRVGIITDSHSVSSTSRKDAWFLNLKNGCRQQGSYNEIPYLYPITLNEKISVIVDVKKKRVAFVIDDDADTWAFKLPKETDITQLHAFVVMQENGNSVTIVDE